VIQEITLSYCDPTYDPSMRRWELQHYGFECTCPACTDIDVDGSFASYSRGRRWRLRDIFDVVDLETDSSERLKMEIECAKLMVEEGMCTPSLAKVYALPCATLLICMNNS
jgi:hypothetical protein